MSPILANIYLNELDEFIQKLSEKYSTRATSRKRYPPYRELVKQRFRARKKGEYRRADEILKQMRQLPTQDFCGPNYIRVKIPRYADDFLVMIIGSKNLAQQIRDEIRDFLKKELQLELSMEKTRITNLGEQRVKFLGYEIAKAK